MNATAPVQPLYLVDASIYIFRAHFSPYVQHRSSRGEDLSALWGFIRFLLDFLRRESPSRVVIAHDMSLFSGFRHALCDRYKSNRELPDESLARQLQGCMEVCSVLGLPAFASKRFEADDIIGVMSSRLRREVPGLPVHIISCDKDLAQLLAEERDSLWDYQAKRRRCRTDIEEELGIRPEQIPDYLGLVGDAVDCIDGVPGIGPVAARALLQEFSSLEGIYLNLASVVDLPLRGASALARRLQLHREKAELSKLLATIVCEIEEPAEPFGHCDLRGVTRQGLDVQGLRAFLATYEFDEADRARLLEFAEPLSGGSL